MIKAIHTGNTRSPAQFETVFRVWTMVFLKLTSLGIKMKDMQAFNRTAISEIVPHLQKIGKIDLCNPDLDW